MSRKKDRWAETRWKRARIAYGYLRDHIAQKPEASRFALSLVDLVLVSNFKGGSATIAETSHSLERKLPHYSKQLELIHAKFKGRGLFELDNSEANRLSVLAKEFCEMANGNNAETKINGFGPSYASALLNAYFPGLLPILDRRVLNALQVEDVKVNAQGQVIDLVSHYPTLIREVRRLATERKCSLEEIDRALFAEPLGDKFKKDAGKRS